MVDYTNEINALRILWEQQQNNFRDICKRKVDIEAEEIFAETAMFGLQTAIDELLKQQGTLI